MRKGGQESRGAADPLAKFLFQLQHTSTPESVCSTSSRSPDGDDDDDTLAGLPSISNSPPLPPPQSGKKALQTTKPGKSSLPLVQQLSPGEVRRQKTPHSNQAHLFQADCVQVNNTSLSLPLSEGEAPHILRAERVTGGDVNAFHVALKSGQEIVDSPGVVKSDHEQQPEESQPAANLENEQRDGIDVINISKNRSRPLTSPTPSSTSPPSSSPVGPSFQPRLIRVLEAPPDVDTSHSSSTPHEKKSGTQPHSAPPLAPIATPSSPFRRAIPAGGGAISPFITSTGLLQVRPAPLQQLKGRTNIPHLQSKASTNLQSSSKATINLHTVAPQQEWGFEVSSVRADSGKEEKREEEEKEEEEEGERDQDDRSCPTASHSTESISNSDNSNASPPSFHSSSF